MKLFTILVSIALFFLLPGCERSRPAGDAVLVRVADRVATEADFFQALELARTPYERDRYDDPQVHRHLCLAILAQLIEELVLDKAAADMGITVSPEQIQDAVAGIRQDYPGQTFERTMLERAVSPQAWEKRLRARLLMAEVTARLPEATAEASPEQIAEAFRRMVSSSDGQADARAVLSLVRQEKKEAAYGQWLGQVQQQMTIAIDPQTWKRVCAGVSPPTSARGDLPESD